MAVEESSVLYFDENDQKEWENAITPLHVVNTPTSYLHDLKNTLEFDRKCRALEVLFEDLQNRIHAFESIYRTRFKN